MMNRFPASVMTTASHLATSPARTITLPVAAVHGRSWVVDGEGVDGSLETIQEAIDAASSGDRILIRPGSYDESLTIEYSKGSLQLIGMGPRGSVGISPSTAAAIGLLCHANDVTLDNVGVAGESTADYAVKVTGSRFRAYRCKFEGVDTSGYAFGFGPGTDAAISATPRTEGRGGDLILHDCEFAWSFDGLNFIASDFGAATQIQVTNCRFHNLSGTCLLGTPGAFGIGSVRNLEVLDSYFGRMEDGTAPSDFINVNDASDTGYFSGNRIALATNAIADLKVGAGVLWMSNATEAGWSTARPA